MSAIYPGEVTGRSEFAEDAFAAVARTNHPSFSVRPGSGLPGHPGPEYPACIAPADVPAENPPANAPPEDDASATLTAASQPLAFVAPSPIPSHAPGAASEPPVGESATIDREIPVAIHGVDVALPATTLPPRPALVPAAANISQKHAEPAFSLDPRGPFLPDPSLSWRVARRVAKTTAPLLAADVLGLALAAIFARAAIDLLLPGYAFSLGWAAPIALLPVLVAYWLSDLYSEVWVHPVVELRQIGHLTTIVFLAAALAESLSPYMPLWCLFAWLGTMALVPLLRRAVRRIFANHHGWGYPTLVIGAGAGAGAAAAALLDVPTSGLRPVLVSDPDNCCRAAGIRVCNDPAQLESFVRSEAIRHAVVSLPEYSPARLCEMLDRYGGLVPHLLVMSDNSTLPSLWGASRNCGRLSGIEVRNALMLATLQGVKRALDVTLAATVLVVGAPLLPIIALLIKRGGPGPIFYGHTRIGRHGRLFTAWKFRTMYPNGDAILAAHLERSPAARAEWERDQKLRRDPRVTSIGRFMRAASLDEFPQLWNVLRGDMSIVGPRPIVPGEIPRYHDNIRLYASVKPGITGLWQVSGRTDTTYSDRVQLDLFYIRHWSPWLDIYILAKTFVALLSRHGAY